MKCSLTPDKILYWGMLGVSILAFAFGVWGAFFADKFLAKRAEAAQKRLGSKAVAMLLSILRILSLVVAALSVYLIYGLFRILPCALR